MIEEWDRLTVSKQPDLKLISLCNRREALNYSFVDGCITGEQAACFVIEYTFDVLVWAAELEDDCGFFYSKFDLGSDCQHF